MYILGDKSTIYVYATQEYMMEAMRIPEYNMRKMQFAQYALKLSEDTKECYVIKDRTATFNDKINHPTKKMLKMIEIMLDDS